VANSRKRITRLNKLTASYEAVILPLAKNPTEPKTSYTISLTDAAYQIGPRAALLAVLLLENDASEQAWLDTGEGLSNPTAPLDYQELLYELTKMTQALNVKGGTVLFRANCPDIELLPILDALNLALIYNTFDWCIPSNTKDEDRWLIVNIDPARLLDFIKSKITDGGLTPELLQWIKDRIDPTTGDQSLIDKINKLIQDLIDKGKLTGRDKLPIERGKGGTTVIENPGGSATNANPSSLDIYVELPACLLFINLPFGSANTDYQNFNMRTAIQDAAVSSGKFNATTEELVSVNVGVQGLTDTGFSYEGKVLTEYIGKNRQLTITDASGRKQQIYYTNPKFGFAGVAYEFRLYSQPNTQLKMLPSTEPVKLDGRFNQSNFISTPPNKNDAAWLFIELCSFVKRPKSYAGGCFVARPEKYLMQFDATTEAIARAAGWRGAWQGGSTGAGAMAGPSHCIIAPSANFSIDFGGKADLSGGFANYTNWRTYLYSANADGSGNPGVIVAGQAPGGIVYDLDVNWSPTQLRHSIMDVTNAVVGQSYVIQARNLDGQSDSGPAQFLYAEITLNGPVQIVTPTGIRVKSV
jgi:hypothetical protein